MKSIRINCFETNSSSQHVLTIANKLNDWNLYANYVKKELERFKQEDRSYKIVLDVKEENMDDEPFELRRFIPHTSFVDKAFYLIGTIHEYFFELVSQLDKIPYDSTWYKNWAKKEKDPEKKAKYEAQYKEAHEKYEAERFEYFKKYAPGNSGVLKKFNTAIRELEEQLEWNLGEYLCERPQGKEETFEDYRKIFPKVEVEIKTYNDLYLNIPYITKDNDFGLGCYDNKEFYFAVGRDRWESTQWLINPYSVVLAGSDEMSTLEQYQQEKEAERLLTEAWDHASYYDNHWPDLTDEEIEEEVEEHCYTWDDSKKAQAELKAEKEELRKFLKENRGKPKMPRGKMIWPVGG